MYPPLAGSERVRGDSGALVKIVLHGLSGSLEADGRKFGDYPNAVPIPAMGGLTDEQIADVLTYVRDGFGSGASPVTADEVKSVRAATAGREKSWTADELKQ